MSVIELEQPQMKYLFGVELPDIVAPLKGIITGRQMGLIVSGVSFVGSVQLFIRFVMVEDIDKDLVLDYLGNWSPRDIDVVLENHKGEVVRRIKTVDCTFVNVSFSFDYSKEGAAEYVAEFKLAGIGMSKP